MWYARVVVRQVQRSRRRRLLMAVWRRHRKSSEHVSYMDNVKATLTALASIEASSQKKKHGGNYQ